MDILKKLLEILASVGFSSHGGSSVLLSLEGVSVSAVSSAVVAGVAVLAEVLHQVSLGGDTKKEAEAISCLAEIKVAD